MLRSQNVILATVIAVLLAGVFSNYASAAPATIHASPCALIDSSATVLHPPAIDMWRMPKNDLGVNELILSAHRDGERFCYNYQLGGITHRQTPVIHVRPGEAFAIRLVNDIPSQAKGEFLNASSLPQCMPMPMHEGQVEHFAGYLNHIVSERPLAMKPVDTNLHMHGYEGLESEDNVFLSTLSSPMHACEYVYHLPSTQPAGTYFFHPHPHGASGDEVDGGLSGVWIVDPPKSQLPAADDHVLFLSYAVPFKTDQKPLNENPLVFGAAAYNAMHRAGRPVAYDPFHPPDWTFDLPVRAKGISMWPYRCDGTRTDVRVRVNGSATPARLEVTGGNTQLLRIVSGLGDGSKQISLRDKTGRAVPMHIVETVGIPVDGDSTHPLARYISTNTYELPPAGRISILVNVPAGQELTLHTDKHCEGYEGARQLSYDLVHIYGLARRHEPKEIVLSRAMTASSDQTPAQQLLAFARAHPSLVHRRALTYTQYIFPAHKRGDVDFAFFITDTTNPNFVEHSYDAHYAPGSAYPTNPDIVVKQGSIEEWYLINATPDRHSFHIHQMSYVLENGPAGFPVSLDVTDVPSGTILPIRGSADRVRVHPTITKILLDFRNVPKGTFPFHCHMLFHEDHGMMGIIRVE
ncbi:MAG TPA: multicopper oxidase domain-containing protein [Candidatus Rubrimentiphilum sp.]|nr:multicopper oxidase domain-containing protein [Candidatus Rubrimentiphilum sp.]